MYTAQATLTSDEADYPPGSTVTLMGSDFIPRETVTLQVLHYGIDGDNDTSAAHQPWTVTADENGDFTTTWIVPPDQDELGATLLATADGKTSLLHAETTFTDNATSITINSPTTGSPISSPAGCSITVNYNYTANSAGGSSSTITTNIKSVTTVVATVTQTGLPKNGTFTNNNVSITIPVGTSVGNYDIEVTGNGVSALQSNALHVVSSITTQPVSSQTVCVGQPASFSVVAFSGSSFQWKKNGTNIPGATSSSLTINSVISSDAATYTVAVITCGNTVTSNNSVLTVNPVSVGGSVSGTATICSGRTVGRLHIKRTNRRCGEVAIINR